MKKIALLLAATACLSLSNNAIAKGPGTAYGKAFHAKSVRTPDQLMQTLSTQPTVTNVAVKGEISQVCQAEGCWIKMKTTSGDEIFVKFREGGFVVPKDIAGKTATVYGTAKKKTISVEARKHIAEDGGASQADIAAITQPKDEVRIDATGVVVE